MLNLLKHGGVDHALVGNPRAQNAAVTVHLYEVLVLSSKRTKSLAEALILSENFT